MKKIISLTLVALMFIGPISIFANDPEREQGVQSLKGKMSTVLQEIDNEKPTEETKYGDTTYKTLSQVKANLSTDYFNRTTETDYMKNKILTMLGQLAVTSAFSIGTAQQAKQTALVNSTASNLEASSDTDYQTLGQKYQTLATQIQEGNSIEADATAAEIQNYVQSVAPTIDSNYKPTQQENALLAGLASILSSSLSSVMGILGSLGIQKLLTLLGQAALSASPIGLAVSAILQSTLGVVFTGITGGGQINWQAVNQTASNQVTNIASKGSSEVQQKIQTNLDQVNTQTAPVIQPTMDTSKITQDSANISQQNSNMPK
jgi:hypothetical protein